MMAKGFVEAADTKTIEDTKKSKSYVYPVNVAIGAEFPVLHID